MPPDDLIRFQHMLDAAREALGLSQERQREDLDDDRLLTLGLVKCIEIIGEAASRIKPETRKRFANIPWNDIIGMRNHLIHIYFEVDLNLVWDTIALDIPPLIAELEKIIKDDFSI